MRSCSLGQDILNSMSSWGAPPGTNAQPWYLCMCMHMNIQKHICIHKYSVYVFLCVCMGERVCVFVMSVCRNMYRNTHM